MCGGRARGLSRGREGGTYRYVTVTDGAERTAHLRRAAGDARRFCRRPRVWDVDYWRGARWVTRRTTAGAGDVAVDVDMDSWRGGRGLGGPRRAGLGPDAPGEHRVVSGRVARSGAGSPGIARPSGHHQPCLASTPFPSPSTNGGPSCTPSTWTMAPLRTCGTCTTSSAALHCGSSSP